jgi:hypothetical protein
VMCLLQYCVVASAFLDDSAIANRPGESIIEKNEVPVGGMCKTTRCQSDRIVDIYQI